MIVVEIGTASKVTKVTDLQKRRRGIVNGNGAAGGFLVHQD